MYIYICIYQKSKIFFIKSLIILLSSIAYILYTYVFISYGTINKQIFLFKFSKNVSAIFNCYKSEVPFFIGLFINGR